MTRRAGRVLEGCRAIIMTDTLKMRYLGNHLNVELLSEWDMIELRHFHWRSALSSYTIRRLELIKTLESVEPYVADSYRTNSGDLWRVYASGAKKQLYYLTFNRFPPACVGSPACASRFDCELGEQPEYDTLVEFLKGGGL
jgi:hypothetical protein